MGRCVACTTAPLSLAALWSDAINRNAHPPFAAGPHPNCACRKVSAVGTASWLAVVIRDMQVRRYCYTGALSGEVAEQPSPPAPIKV